MDALSELKALSVLGHMFLLWSPACYFAEQRIKAGLTELHIQHNLQGRWAKRESCQGSFLPKSWLGLGFSQGLQYRVLAVKPNDPEVH